MRGVFESHGIASTVRQRIERGGERLWGFEDFRDLPMDAVAQALSRMTRDGTIQRLSKGVYFHPRSTAFGVSLPNPAILLKHASATKRRTFFPADEAAANMLGFSTQSPRRATIATTALSAPKKLLGTDTVVHTRRPEAWRQLSETDAAFLDFLRRGGRTSELTPAETIRRALKLAAEDNRFERLLAVAESEPPRVRAILGALGVALGKTPTAVDRLRSSLNPFSKFDFGLLAGLPDAHRWQAKGESGR